MLHASRLRWGFLALVSASVASTGWVALAPEPCWSVPSCAARTQAAPKTYHMYMFACLGTLLMWEVSQVVVTLVDFGFRTWRGKGQDPRLSASLMCLTLIVLLVTEALFACLDVVWAHNSLRGPVYTLRFVEWLLTVPLLLLLGACGALERPLEKALGPILWTEAYIVVSWVALLVKNPFLCGLLVCMTFGGYGWASYGMLQWIASYKAEATAGAPCPRLRVAAVFLLIALFALYGVNYLCALFQVISQETELFIYSVMGFGSKAGMSMIFNTLRSSAQTHALTGQVTRNLGLGSALYSLLRAKFDVLIDCTADGTGKCTIVAREDDAHLRELERCLGLHLTTDTDIAASLAGAGERARFKSYVRNTISQTWCAQRNGDGGEVADVLSSGINLPLAQVMHFNFRRAGGGSEHGPHDGNDGQHLGNENRVISAVVHLSVVPRVNEDAFGQTSGLTVGTRSGMRQQVILGIRLQSQEHAEIRASSVSREHNLHVLQRARLRKVARIVYHDAFEEDPFEGAASGSATGESAHSIVPSSTSSGNSQSAGSTKTWPRPVVAGLRFRRSAPRGGALSSTSRSRSEVMSAPFARQHHRSKRSTSTGEMWHSSTEGDSSLGSAVESQESLDGTEASLRTSS